MKQKISKLKDMILNLMYPQNIKCMFCMEELNQNSYNNTCENCLNVLPFITNPCEKCGSPMNENQVGVCFKCKNKNYNFVLAKSIFEYKDMPLMIVHNLKYNGKKYLVDYIVRYMLDVFATWNVFPDFITCVPMIKAKEKEREYNQSKLMAEKFAKEVKIPFYEFCYKSKNTDSQTELNTNQRIKNVVGSFEFIKENKKLIKNKTILIIDDIITTGATVNEISKVLLGAGAKECYALSFAHTRLNKIDVQYFKEDL